MNFSEKLLTLRKKNGYTQAELAEQLQVSRQSVSKWELGTAQPELTNWIGTLNNLRISFIEFHDILDVFIKGITACFVSNAI